MLCHRIVIMRGVTAIGRQLNNPIPMNNNKQHITYKLPNCEFSVCMRHMQPFFIYRASLFHTKNSSSWERKFSAHCIHRKKEMFVTLRKIFSCYDPEISFGKLSQIFFFVLTRNHMSTHSAMMSHWENILL